MFDGEEELSIEQLKQQGQGASQVSISTVK
jgi:hypothetical protein